MPVCTGLSLELAYGVLQEKHTVSNISVSTRANHQPQHPSQLTPASTPPSCFRLPRSLLPLLPLRVLVAILLGVCVPCHMAPSRLRTSSSSSLSVARNSTFLQVHGSSMRGKGWGIWRVNGGGGGGQRGLENCS